MSKIERLEKAMIPIVALLFLIAAQQAYGQGILPYVDGGFRALNGSNLALGKICTTVSGTGTNLASYPTYADAVAGTNPNANPVLLNAVGRPDNSSGEIWLAGSTAYRIRIIANGTGGTACNGTTSGIGVDIQFVDGITSGVTVINAITINGVQMCDQYPGSDASAKIAACIAALPSSGGVIWCYGLQGNQALTTDPFVSVTKRVTVLMAAATYGMSTVDVTIPENIQMVLQQGAVFSVGPGRTLTVNGSMQGSSRSSHFSGSGTTLLGSLAGPAYVEWFGALCDSATNDAGAIQDAFDSMGVDGVVEFPYAATCNLGTTGITINYAGLLITGNRTALTYSGTGYGIDIVPSATPIFRSRVRINGLDVACTGAAGTCIRWRSSYGAMTDVNVAPQGAASVGFLITGQGGNGTGPYYNDFYGLTCQTAAVAATCLDMGYDSVANYGPNANNFYGGRMAGTGIANQVCVNLYGVGNRFYGMTTESCSTHYNIAAPVVNQTIDNLISAPYVEGGLAAVGFSIGANSIRTSIVFPLITGVTTAITVDAIGSPTGQNTTFMQNDVSAAGFQWPVQSSTWTPTFASIANLDSTPTASTPAYIRVGPGLQIFGMVVTVDPTTVTTETTFSMTLPFASNFTIEADASGSCGNVTADQNAAAYADAASDKIYIGFTPAVTTSFKLYCTLGYRIK